MAIKFKTPMEPRVRTTGLRYYAVGGGVSRAGGVPQEERPIVPLGSGSRENLGERFSPGQTPPPGQTSPARTGTLRSTGSPGQARERVRQQRLMGQSMGWTTRSPGDAGWSPTVSGKDWSYTPDAQRERLGSVERKALPPSGMQGFQFSPHSKPLSPLPGQQNMRGSTDTVPGMLTPGEYVLPTWLVQDIQTGRPPGASQYMSGGGMVRDPNQPGYQMGGLVRPDFQKKPEETGALIIPQRPQDRIVADPVVPSQEPTLVTPQPAGPALRTTPAPAITVKPGAPPSGPSFDFSGVAPTRQYRNIDQQFRESQGSATSSGTPASSETDQQRKEREAAQSRSGYNSAMNDDDNWSDDPIPAGINPGSESWNWTMYSDMQRRASEVANSIFGAGANPEDISAIRAVLDAGYDIAADGTVFYAMRDEDGDWNFYSMGNLETNSIYLRAKQDAADRESEAAEAEEKAGREAIWASRGEAAQKGVEAAKTRGADLIRKSAELAAKNKARAAGQAVRGAFMAMATRPGEAGLAQAADMRQVAVLAGATEQLVGELEAQKMILGAELEGIAMEMKTIDERLAESFGETSRRQAKEDQRELMDLEAQYRAQMMEIEAQIAKAMEPSWWDKHGGAIIGAIGTIGGAAVGFLASGGNPAGAAAGASAGGALAGMVGDPTNTYTDPSSGYRYQGNQRTGYRGTN